MSKYYDGTKILTLKDIDGDSPTFYLVVGNRTAGKTFFFKRLLLRKFKRYAQKFIVLVRYRNDLEDLDKTFFKDIESIEKEFRGHKFESKLISDLYLEFFLDGESCGYALALNSSEKIKRISSVFVDADYMFFDEFQSKTYLPKETELIQNIYISIARGEGKPMRDVKVFMCSNTISAYNPYFIEFGVNERMQDNTKFLRGSGWVLEKCFVENASSEIKKSGLAKAFKNSNYIEHATNNMNLNDSDNLVECLSGEKSMYVVLISDGVKYGVWIHQDTSYLYVCKQYDPLWHLQISYKNVDHKKNVVLETKSNKLAKYFKKCYEFAQVRFEDQMCKNVFIEFIGYTML